VRGAWAGILLSLAFVFLAAPPAAAQTRAEPVLFPVDGEAVVIRKARVPFSPTDDLSFATPRYDDGGWWRMQVPSWWHGEGLSRTDRIGWYRLHVRFAAPPPDGMAIIVPPAFGAWEVYVGGRLVGRGGSPGRGMEGLAREASTLVRLPRRHLRTGDNVVAIRLGSAEGIGGLLGPLRLGTESSLRRYMGRKSLVASGLLLVFTVLMLFHAGAWFVNPSDRASAMFGLTMGVVALHALANNDHWYLLAESTELKLRLRFAARFGIVGAGALFFAAAIGKEKATRPATALAWASGIAAALALLGPFGVAAQLHGLSWVLLVMAQLYCLDLAQGLPVSSPMIASGVRAGLVGSMLALFYEVLTGTHELPEPGVFELGTLPLAFALVGTVAIGAGLAHVRAARVVTASRDGIVVLREDNQVELSNPAMHSLLGRGPSQLRRDGLWNLLDMPDRQALGRAVGRLRAQGHDAPTEVLQLELDALGKRIRTEVVALQIDQERVLLSFRDVSEREALQKEVARAQRLDSLGLLAGGIAHDFNNLLAGILASASDLESAEGLSARERERRIRAIVEASRRGGALTQRLLQFARGRSEVALGVDLEVLLPDMVDMLGRTLGKQVDWHLDVEVGLPLVGIDDGELEQLVVNLCVNARDAMGPSGGRIELSAGLVEGEAEEPLVRLTVRDDGPGIPQEIRDRVFEPFVTTKGSGAGTGLGLAVVYGIVTGRGGDLVLESEPGQGTSVHLLLPVHDDTPSDSLPVEGVPAEPRPGLRVMLVDDEPALRSFLSGALERRGVTVTTFPGGGEALRWAHEPEREEPPVDAVVMDMMMPDVDGLEASQALRDRWPGIPIVISSGYTGPEGIRPVQRTGPTVLLGKPYQVEDLLHALARVTADLLPRPAEDHPDGRQPPADA